MKNRGFTLFEIIVVLILVGIISLFASFALIDALESYIQYKSYSEYGLKIEVAVNRLYRELKELHGVADYSSDKIRYERNNRYYTIALVGDKLKINMDTTYPDEEKGYVLIDKVGNFSVKLLKSDNSTEWKVGDQIEELAKIDVSFTIDVDPPININFSVNPWYNDTYNGP